MHFIYSILNTINDKIYIGQSKDVNQRWRAHKSAVKNDRPTQIVHHAMIKYGLDNFTFEIIASCLDQDAANESEEKIIYQYKSIDNRFGYNKSLGGEVAPKSEEFKQAMRNHWADPSFKEKVSNSISEAYSKKSPEEMAEKAAKIKQIKSDWTDEKKNDINQRISKSLTGVPFTPERIFNIKKSKEGKKYLAWNKGSKGLCKVNKTSFKTGMIPYNKGTHIINSGCFVVGHSINKGKKYKKRTITAKGENHSQVKLTNDNVLEIVSLYQSGSFNQTNLAIKFNVSRGAIKKIITGETWGHITGISNIGIFNPSKAFNL
jgi:group I intron endonuclease